MPAAHRAGFVRRLGCAGRGGAGGLVPTPFGTTVEVSRIVTEVRVVDRSGEPVQGLDVDDFKVTLNGRPVTVESVSWVPTSREATVEPPIRRSRSAKKQSSRRPNRG